MTHRKLKHIETVAYCKKKLEGKCSFSDEMCWWKHTGDQHSTEENIECFICHNNFESKPNLMRHRKISHPNVIRQSNNLNMCKFQGSSRWFRHDEKAMETDETGNRGVKENSEENVKSDSVFQKAFMNIKPLRFMGINAAGLRSKLFSFKKVLNDLKPSVFFIEETKYKDAGKLKLDDYLIFEKVRKS